MYAVNTMLKIRPLIIKATAENIYPIALCDAKQKLREEASIISSIDMRVITSPEEALKTHPQSPMAKRIPLQAGIISS
jgi:hypothetical protein